MSRPTSPESSLAEIAVSAKSVSPKRRNEQFGDAMRNFLDAFYAADKKHRVQMLQKEPAKLRAPLKDEGVADAYLAALANYLASQFRISPPLWAQGTDRRPDEPWFALNHPDARMWLITQSPAAFRERDLFISEDALTRR